MVSGGIPGLTLLWPWPKWPGPRWAQMARAKMGQNGLGLDGPSWPGPRWAKMARAQMGQDGPGPDGPSWPGPTWATQGKWFRGRMALPQGFPGHPQGEMDSKAVANPLDVPKSPKPTLEKLFPRISHFFQVPSGPQGWNRTVGPVGCTPLWSSNTKQTRPSTCVCFHLEHWFVDVRAAY